MKYVEKIAKTVDDAVTEALLDLMVTRDDVEIEIIDKGSKGFLGIGAKDAHVKVTLKNKEEEQSVFEELIEEPIIENTDVKVAVKEDPVEVGMAFLKEVLSNMEIDATIEATITKERINMVISGDKMGLLIGKRGETIDALQYLVNLVVNKNSEKYTRVVLDTENYRQRREETLKKLAFRLAKKASQTNKKIVLEPMNPYDRRIIHSALQNSKTVKTYSEGKEPYRKIVIIPIGMDEQNK